RASAAGHAAREAIPAARDSPAAGFGALLLLVRTSNRRGRDRAADDAGDCDQRQYVRQREQENPREEVLPEVPRGEGVVRQPLRERAREAEQQRGAERAERAPLAEDQGGERDEATALGHVLVERVDESDREVRASERRQHPGED